MIKFAILAATFALSAGAHAESPINIGASRSAIVQLGDLNLATVEGRSVLNRRVASAIEEVCGSYANAREPGETDRIDSCRLAARRSAERQLAALATSMKLAAADNR